MFYTSVAYGTLVVDAYLALACAAIRALPREGHQYLPPFGWIGASEAGRILVLSVATWTAILALGCLRATDAQHERSHAAAVLWVALVLAMTWLLVLVPLITELLRELLVWGP